MLITLLIHFPLNWISRVESAVEGFQALIAPIILTTKHVDRGRVRARGARAMLLDPPESWTKTAKSGNKVKGFNNELQISQKFVL